MHSLQKTLAGDLKLSKEDLRFNNARYCLQITATRPIMTRWKDQDVENRILQI